MDKLIVTLIGIALTATSILWGVDYIGAFYQTAQAKVKAQRWVTEAAQITVAARQAGSLSLTGDDWKQGSSSGLTAAALVPTYLIDLPKHSGNYVFWPCYITGGNTSCPRYTTDSTHTTDATIIQATVENVNVCKQIYALANRGSTTLPTATVTGTNPISINVTIPQNANQQFTCLNASGTYYFLYRVYLDR